MSKNQIWTDRRSLLARATRGARFTLSACALFVLAACASTQEFEGDESQAALAADEEVSGKEQALSLGVQCLVLPGDGVSCPSGYSPELDGRVFTCEKVDSVVPSCALGYALRTQANRDTCVPALGFCTPGTACVTSSQCPSGYSLRVDASGNGDRCRKRLFANPLGCFGNPELGVSCPDDAERVEVPNGKFRCVDEARPTCLLGFAIAVRPGADTCNSGPVALAPQCNLSLPTAVLHGLETDVAGNADRCVAHGWPLPAPVTGN